MEGGNSFNFIVNIDVKILPCSAPFIVGGTLSDRMTKDIILDDTADKYKLRKFRLTNDDASCTYADTTGVISPASAAVTLSKAASYRFDVKPNDPSTI